jgi:uncharacterized protein (TIGR00303 family)
MAGKSNPASATLLLVAGSTATARIEGISAAGSDPDLAAHTPSADAELLTHGEVVDAPAVPVSPTGCPTPAVITRAVVETLDLDTLVLDAGISKPTAAETLSVDAVPGRDVREPVAVPDAGEIYETAVEIGQSLSAERLVVGETIPGGTTTAMAVLAALGEPHGVSSSLPENPTSLKREVVAEGFTASEIGEGALAGEPFAAVRRMGDPVLPAVAGVARGAADAGIDVTLGGGTQMAAAAALLRHAGVSESISVATTQFVADDESADLDALATALDLAVTVTDPAFEALDEHPVAAGFLAGEAKEGVGAGGALALAAESDVELAAVRRQIEVVYERVVGSEAVPDSKA